MQIFFRGIFVSHFVGGGPYGKDPSKPEILIPLAAGKIAPQLFQDYGIEECSIMMDCSMGNNELIIVAEPPIRDYDRYKLTPEEIVSELDFNDASVLGKITSRGLIGHLFS